MTSAEPVQLDELVTEFADLEPRERLELLLEYCDNLPKLPPELEAEKAAGMHRVHECQTPVFLWVDLVDGLVRIQADVAPEAPTVKGFVGILVSALSGKPPQAVLAVPTDLLNRLGLVEALGMMRTRGLGAIVHRIREETRRAVAA
ncbi:MAG: SufE family protein [Pirellulales bacterium]|nr:SufE family protein [Pirellulales bacterium]